MTLTAPIVKVERWFWRYSTNIVASCRLETFRDPQGHYSVLVTERADNPGPSVTQAHRELRRAVRDWLKLDDDAAVVWYEQYDADSYTPPDDSRREISMVFFSPFKNDWHSVHVDDEQWEEIYINPQRPKPVVRRRKKREVLNGSD